MTINKNVKIIIICVLVFAIWAGLAVYRTIGENPDWFEEKKLEEAVEEIKEEINTTDKQEFTYALAWSKYGNNWVCVNIAGDVEIVLDEEYIEELKELIKE